MIKNNNNNNNIYEISYKKYTKIEVKMYRFINTYFINGKSQFSNDRSKSLSLNSWNFQWQ